MYKLTKSIMWRRPKCALKYLNWNIYPLWNQKKKSAGRLFQLTDHAPSQVLALPFDTTSFFLHPSQHDQRPARGRFKNKPKLSISTGALANGLRLYSALFAPSLHRWAFLQRPPMHPFTHQWELLQGAGHSFGSNLGLSARNPSVTGQLALPTEPQSPGALTESCTQRVKYTTVCILVFFLYNFTQSCKARSKQRSIWDF